MKERKNWREKEDQNIDYTVTNNLDDLTKEPRDKTGASSPVELTLANIEAVILFVKGKLAKIRAVLSQVQI